MKPSLLSSLPAPKHGGESHGEGEDIEDLIHGGLGTAPTAAEHKPSSQNPRVPPYPQRRAQKFVPRRQADFCDGGAYPEIHVAQYPLNMGKPGSRAADAEGTLALTVNAEGDFNYDAIVTGGKNAAKWQETGHKAIVPKLERLNDAFERPAEEEEDAVATETILALQGKVDKKQAVMNPKHVPRVPGEAQYIRYTGSSAGAEAAGRIIKMQDMPVDPLEPPKFKHIKVPRGSGSPPAPVMHSPPRKLSADEQRDWKIPPCVSNWKNNAGHTIPLDKRLAADGRGLQEVQINDGFAKFSEALYIAENKARNAVETRAKMQRELLSREKERKEAELRELAMNARMERSGRMVDRRSVGDDRVGRDDREEGVAVVIRDDDRDDDRDHGRDDRRGRDFRDDHNRRDERTHRNGRDDVGHRGREHSASPGGHRRFAPHHGDRDDGKDRRDSRGNGEYFEAQRRRDEIREDRRKERERERRLEARNAHGYKRSKLTRDKDRDISEKVALGMAKVTGGEAMYDERLFNQETSQQAGMGTDDTYNLYDKPLFTDRSDVYRGRASNRDGDDPGVDTSRFKPSKGFSGADKSSGKAVEFEKEGDGGVADPFGLDDFLSK